jgi:excisionase family DNA binding protein
LNKIQQENHAAIDTIVTAKIQELVDAHNLHQVQSPADSGWLTVAQLLEYLSISRQGMYNYIRKGLLTRYEFGDRVYFKKDEVNAAFKKQHRPDGTRNSPRRSNTISQKAKGGAASW